MQPRIEEILSMCLQKLDKSGMIKNIKAGIVITGGSALIPDIVTLTENISNSLAARIGIPCEDWDIDDIVKTPMYSNVLGALRITSFKENSPRYGKSKSGGFFAKLTESIMKTLLEKKTK